MSTAIEWTNETWNAVTGCDQVSPGCDNCYALTLAGRLKAMGSAKYQTDGDPRTSGPGFGVALHEDTLTAPLRWRKPRRVFVNSMSDLFHASVPDEFIARVFAVMACAPRHTFQILTKRHARMRALLSSERFWTLFAIHFIDYRDGLAPTSYVHGETGPYLSNVWLGVSVEDQHWADIRIPALVRSPAAVRFLSCEPLLGPLPSLDLSGIGWVIAGGESGPAHRPCDPDWVRGIRDACEASRTPFFFKQWGGWRPTSGGRLLDGRTWDEFPTAGAVTL